MVHKDRDLKIGLYAKPSWKRYEAAHQVSTCEYDGAVLSFRVALKHQAIQSLVPDMQYIQHGVVSIRDGCRREIHRDHQ